ncbi:MAG: insulinase family protein [Bacteroidetes bacterium]|nr:insulinase family protein [Bacteroidota bacterium]
MTEHRKFILPNGITVSAEKLDYAKSVLISIWVLAGSRHEKPELFGISHLLEHLVFKGTQSRKIYHIANGIESVGGYINAMTDKESTCYYVRIPADQLDRGLDILTDLVFHPVFKATDLEKEKQVVIDELMSVEDNLEDWIGDVFEEQVFAGTDLAHPVIGTRESVQGIQLKDIEERAKFHLDPSKILITVSGQFNFSVLEKKLIKYTTFSSVSTVLPGVSIPASDLTGDILLKKPVNQNHLVIGRNAAALNDDKSSSLMLINAVLGGGMSSRLNLKIRERYGFCYSIYSFTSFYSDTGAFGIYAATDPGKFGKMESLVKKELDLLQKDSLTPREFRQVKQSLIGSLEITSESLSNRHSMMAKSEVHYGRFKPFSELIKEIADVTSDQVRSYLDEYPLDGNLVKVIIQGES